jgi:hypothetical protein
VLTRSRPAMRTAQICAGKRKYSSAREEGRPLAERGAFTATMTFGETELGAARTHLSVQRHKGVCRAAAEGKRPLGKRALHLLPTDVTAHMDRIAPVSDQPRADNTIQPDSGHRVAYRSSPLTAGSGKARASLRWARHARSYSPNVGRGLSPSASYHGGAACAADEHIIHALLAIVLFVRRSPHSDIPAWPPAHAISV